MVRSSTKIGTNLPFRLITVLLILLFQIPTYAADISAEKDIADLFSRVVTRGKDGLPLEKYHENSFHHHPWVDDWYYSDKEDSSTPRNQFTQELYTRLIKKKDSLDPVKDLILGDTREENRIINSIEPKFSSGHMIKIEGITSKPHVLLTLYAGNSVNPQSPKPTCWFIPIEQALSCSTLGHYRQRVAVLKIWGAYTHFALLAIPPGSKVKYFVGLVSPQSFPALNFEVKERKHITDFNKNVELLSMKESLPSLSVDIDCFFEKLEGGATQIYLVDVEKEKCHFFSLESLEFSKLKGKKGYASAKPEELCISENGLQKKIPIRVWSEDGGPSHFKDEAYDSTQINIIDQLCSKGILNDSESNKMKDMTRLVYSKL